MEVMVSYTQAAVERAMKVQEVILRAMAKKITWWQGAEIIGISDRQMRRWHERYEEFGFRGLFDRRRGKPPPQKGPLAVVEEVLGVYREKYLRLKRGHFPERVEEVSEWRGVFCGLYSDRARHFWLTAKGGEAVDHDRLTQVGRALRELGVRMIPAYSPQARGRSERSFGTWQGRLPQELRLRGIRTVEAANAFLRQHYIGEFNRCFQVEAAQPGSAFVPYRGKDLERIFSLQFERTVNRDNTVSFQNLTLPIEPVRWRGTLAGCTATPHQHPDGNVSLHHGPHRPRRYGERDGPTLYPQREPRTAP